MRSEREMIDTLQIRCRRHRNEHAPTLFMTNAWPLSLRCWDSTWEAFASSFDLLAVDLPGFGLSQGHASLMRPSAQGQFVLKLLDHFQLEQVHGVGPDVGVPVMLWLAEHHPERLHSIIIFNGPGFYPPYVAWELQALIRSGVVRTLTSRVGNLFAYVAMRRGYRHFKPTPAAITEYQTFNGDRRRFGLTLEYLASYPAELAQIGQQLTSIQCPVLLVWGEQDPFIKLENAHVLRQTLPTCRFHPLADCGHFAHEDAGRVFVEVVSRWCLEAFAQAR